MSLILPFAPPGYLLPPLLKLRVQHWYQYHYHPPRKRSAPTTFLPLQKLIQILPSTMVSVMENVVKVAMQSVRLSTLVPVVKASVKKSNDESSSAHTVSV